MKRTGGLPLLAATELLRRPWVTGETVRRIIIASAQAWEVSPARVLTVDRTGHVVHARQTAALLSKEITGRPTRDLGRLLRRDHKTIAAAIERARARVQSDALFSARVARVRCEVTE